MQKALSLYDTAIGKKAVMAVSGLVLFGFVIGHMLGNLQLYLGPEALNEYAHKVKSIAPLLWGTRALVALSLVLHVVTTVQLYKKTSAARPQAYRMKKSIASTYASRTMKFTGPVLLFYILFHLAHFTAPGLDLGHEFSRTDVYSNVVAGFSIPWVAALYILGNLCLGFHLYHGSWSLMQSLGLSHPRYHAKRKLIAQTFAFVVAIANISFPVAVLTGIVK